jgi:glucosyl-dolichyl phosphate glucuronosyltransferase
MTSPRLELSIVICTRNRAQLLAQAIRSVVGQPFPAAAYEILVVDDNATDDTAAVTRELAKQFPQVRYAHSAGRGLLPARFTGQREALGRYIGFLDDDAKACADWLERAARIIRERAPLCFGGPFFPFYVSAKPDWYRDAYGSATHGDTARELKPEEVLCGGNVFFAAEPLRASGGFDPNYCQPGERWTYGDEEVPQVRLHQAHPGQPFYYDPQLFILHLVRPERLNLVRAARECFAMGRAFIKVRGLGPGEHRRLPYAWRAAYYYARFWGKALVGSLGRDRQKHPFAQNYIYEVAFADLRQAGLFFQALQETHKRRSQPLVAKSA